MDYLTTRSYPDFFHSEQSPSWISAVLDALGRPLDAGDWCEIGCGRGFTATLLAAANPSMRLTAIDINPDHIAFAQSRAKAAGLTNVEFICADIREVDLQRRFTHIVCHGVASWVAPEVLRAISMFTAKHLATNGSFALQYMSEPGGAAFRAFHSVFRSVAHLPDPVAEALSQLRAMREAKAGFFQLHPHAGQALDQLFAEDADYLAHEYLNPHFNPLAFRDVQALMQDAGLAFLGSATPIENIDAVSVPASTAPLIARTKDPVLRETLKDLSRNQVMRYDLYGRPKAGLSEQAHLTLLRKRIWGWLPGAPDLSKRRENLSFDTRIGPVEGDLRIFGPLFARLAQGPARFEQIEETEPFKGRPGLLNQTLQIALWAKMVHPLRAKTDTEPARRLNHLLLADVRNGKHVPALAAPAIGSGLALSKPDIDRIAAGDVSPNLARFFAL